MDKEAPSSLFPTTKIRSVHETRACDQQRLHWICRTSKLGVLSERRHQQGRGIHKEIEYNRRDISGNVGYAIMNTRVPVNIDGAHHYRRRLSNLEEYLDNRCSREGWVARQSRLLMVLEDQLRPKKLVKGSLDCSLSTFMDMSRDQSILALRIRKPLSHLVLPNVTRFLVHRRSLN